VLYGEIEALRGVSISGDEDRWDLASAQRCRPKLTTLRCNLGLAQAGAAKSCSRAKSIAGLGPEAIVRLGISPRSEGRRIFPGLSVKKTSCSGARTGASLCANPRLSREADACRTVSTQVVFPCARLDPIGRAMQMVASRDG